MTKIFLNIEADSVTELMETVNQFSINPVPVLQKAVDEVTEKKQQKKSVQSKKETKKQEKVSTEKTSEDSSSSAEKEPEKSITEGQHPNASKKDVQALMKKAMDSGHRAEIKTAFGRFNAAKLSELKEEDYSAFITDLEALLETAGD